MIRVIDLYATPSGRWMAQVLYDRDGHEFSDFLKFQTRPGPDEIRDAAMQYMMNVTTYAPAPVESIVPSETRAPLTWRGRLIVRIIRFLRRWVR